VPIKLHFARRPRSAYTCSGLTGSVLLSPTFSGSTPCCPLVSLPGNVLLIHSSTFSQVLPPQGSPAPFPGQVRSLYRPSTPLALRSLITSGNCIINCVISCLMSSSLCSTHAHVGYQGPSRLLPSMLEASPSSLPQPAQPTSPGQIHPLFSRSLQQPPD
jgi:hypothetical protein